MGADPQRCPHWAPLYPSVAVQIKLQTSGRLENLALLATLRYLATLDYFKETRAFNETPVAKALLAVCQTDSKPAQTAQKGSLSPGWHLVIKKV